MPHSLLRRIVIGAPAAAIAVLACARSGELRVLADSTTAPGAVEVLALPADRALATAEDPARRAADSIAALYRATRIALNAHADSLARTDRRTSAYAAAYDSFAASRAAAERLRETRDSARRAAPAGKPLPDSVLNASVRAPLAHGAATLRLREGEWRLGFIDAHGVLTRAPITVTIKAKAHDTLVVRPTP